MRACKREREREGGGEKTDIIYYTNRNLILLSKPFAIIIAHMNYKIWTPDSRTGETR